MTADSGNANLDLKLEAKSSHSQDGLRGTGLLDFSRSEIHAAWDLSSQRPVNTTESGISTGGNGSIGEQSEKSISFNTQNLFAEATGNGADRRADRSFGGSDIGVKSEASDKQTTAENDNPSTEARSLPDAAKPEIRQQYMEKPENRLSTDIHSLWNKDDRVLAIGDQHLTTGIKQHTIDNMKTYAEAGATAIGMELFPMNSQPKLDHYAELKRDPSSSPEDLSKARKAIEETLRQSQEGPDDPPENREEARLPIEKTIQIIDAAIDAGIRPIALEPNISRAFAGGGGYSLMHETMRNLPPASQADFDIYTNPESTPEQRESAKQAITNDLAKGQISCWSPDKIASAVASLDEGRESGLKLSGMQVARGPEDNDADWNNRLHDMRNKTWSEQTAKFLNENPNQRMLLFAGTQHFQYEQRGEPNIDSANERLNKLGIGATVLQFAGGDFARPQHFDQELKALSKFYAETHGIAPGADEQYPAPPDSAQSAALRYTLPAQKANVATEQFAIRLQAKGPREADYIIHLPQN